MTACPYSLGRYVCHPKCHCAIIEERALPETKAAAVFFGVSVGEWLYVSATKPLKRGLGRNLAEKTRLYGDAMHGECP